MDDAEFFLKSEIDRLVYGHLKSLDCDEISARFLNSSPSLSECRELVKRNRTFKTEANGLSLQEILNQYLNMSNLILNTVNKAVGDSEKFCDPVEALQYILKPKESSNTETVHLAINDDDLEHSDNQSVYSSSSGEMYSDFSLNLKTPDKEIPPKRNSKKKLEPIIEGDDSTSNQSKQNTSSSDKSPSSPMKILPRQSIRLQNKRSCNLDRLTNSDGIKELRKNPISECETPCKLGKPPYSETKLQKPKSTIALSSDSDTETDSFLKKSTPNKVNSSENFQRTVAESESKLPAKSASPVTNIDNKFSEQRSFTESPSTVTKTISEDSNSNSSEKPVTAKKKTIKVLKPRRPPIPVTSPLKRPSKIDIIRNNRRGVDSFFDTKRTSKSSNRKSELTNERRSSEEVFLEPPEKPKTRRRSSHLHEDDKALLKENRLRKSLPIIDEPNISAVIKDKLIVRTELHEHLAANINKVIINSPQKIITSASTEELDHAIQKVVDETESSPLFEDILNELMRDLEKETNGLEDQNTVPSTGTETDLNTPVEETVQSQFPQPTESEKPVADNESHNGEPNAIIIELQQEPVSNPESYDRNNFHKPIEVSENIRNYVSHTADISSSPDRNHIEVGTSESVINLYSSQNSNIVRSSVVENDRIYLNANSILYPINDGVPVLINDSTKFEIYGEPMPIPQPSIICKKKYVPIAPKCSNLTNYADIVSTVDRNVSNGRKKRTRGGKRST